jgi:cyclic pyranopterin phosphate synthase
LRNLHQVRLTGRRAHLSWPGRQNDLRPLLRAGATLDELQGMIREAIGRKPERHEFATQPEKVIRFMSYTGG